MYTLVFLHMIVSSAYAHQWNSSKAQACDQRTCQQ